MKKAEWIEINDGSRNTFVEVDSFGASTHKGQRSFYRNISSTIPAHGTRMSALIRSRRNTQERKETLLILLQQYCGGLLYFTEKGQILSSAFEVKHCRESWDVLDL